MTTPSSATTLTTRGIAAFPADPHPAAPQRAEFHSLILRTDPGCAHADLTLARPAAYDATAALTGSITDPLPLIVRVSDEVSPDLGATDAMAAVLITFVGIADGQHGITRWSGVPPALAHQFVGEDGLDDDASLARNTVRAAYLALGDHGVPTGYETDPQQLSPVDGLLPVPS